MLSGSIALSAETRRFGALRVPAMLIDGVQVSAEGTENHAKCSGIVPSI
jgi:hypothetical protein